MIVSFIAEEEKGCPAGWVNAHHEGCFSFLIWRGDTFLGEETKFTWIDASIACEQVILRLRMKTNQLEDHLTLTYCLQIVKDFLKQAGGYLAEPQSLEQMEFLTGIAGLEADFTGIRN